MLKKENQFQESISRRFHITCVEFVFWWGVGGGWRERERKHTCVRMRPCAQAKIRTSAPSGNQNRLQPPRVREQSAALSCVYEQVGPGPHICGPVADSCPWPDVPHTKRTSSQHRALMNYSWTQEPSTVRKALTRSESSQQRTSSLLSPPSVIYSAAIPGPAQLLSHGLWKAG